MKEDRPRRGRAAKSPGYEQLLRELNEALAGAELPGTSVPAAPRRPVLFIVGAPRSGTTLLYQVLAASGRFAYCTNLVARFYAAPAIGARVQRLLAPLLDRPPIPFRSHGGRTEGWNGPHEFGYFWERFFPFEAHHEPSPAALAGVKVDRLRRELAALESELGGPLLFKSVILVFVLRYLAEALPTARFLCMERPWPAVAASIRRMRLEYYGTTRAWFSVRPSPRRIPHGGPPEKEIAVQLRAVRDALAEAEAAVGPERWRRVRYEDLCADPRGAVRRICRWAGLRSPPRAAAIPDRFPPRNDSGPAAQARRLHRALREEGLIP